MLWQGASCDRSNENLIGVLRVLQYCSIPDYSGPTTSERDDYSLMIDGHSDAVRNLDTIAL